MVTEYYQQLPDGALVEVKPLPEGERAVQKPQVDTAPARGAREPPGLCPCCCPDVETGDKANVLHCCG